MLDLPERDQWFIDLNNRYHRFLIGTFIRWSGKSSRARTTTAWCSSWQLQCSTAMTCNEILAAVFRGIPFSTQHNKKHNTRAWPKLFTSYHIFPSLAVAFFTRSGRGAMPRAAIMPKVVLADKVRSRSFSVARKRWRHGLGIFGNWTAIRFKKFERKGIGFNNYIIWIWCLL